MIAGNGQFPALFSRAAKKAGINVFAVGHVNETRPELEKDVQAMDWVKIGQLEKIISFFKTNKVSHAVMIGGITKARLFSEFEPDELALQVLASLDATGDDMVLRAIGGALEQHGIRMMGATAIMPGLLAESGCWTKRTPDENEEADMKLAFNAAKKIGELDIGQCVIAAGGSIVCVEAIEGTDAAIRRAGELGAKNAAVVKVCKPNQDSRFDLPAAGARTIETMVQSGAATVLAVEAGASVVFDKEEMVKLADENKIAIVGL